MGIITEEVTIKLHAQQFKYFEEKGYDVSKRIATGHGNYKDGLCYDGDTPITVKVSDLPKGSHQIVEIECDYCHDIYPIEYKNAKKQIDKYGNCCCQKCMGHSVIGIQNKYGEQYTNVFQVPKVQQRISETLNSKYGVDNVRDIPGIQEKAKETCLKKYNYSSPLQVPEIRERIKETCRLKYGGNAPTSSYEVKKKVQETYYRNGSKMASSQQMYIGQLYGGKINYPLGSICLDIAFPEEKIICEYNGSGHWLSIEFGDMTESEFTRKEIARNIYIRNNGYKMIIIISRKDKLPSDEILYAMLYAAEEYFRLTDHTWIEYDIDNNIVRCAIQKDGAFFDYGDLHLLKRGMYSNN